MIRTRSFLIAPLLAAGLSACIERPLPPRDERAGAESQAPAADAVSALEGRLQAAPAVRLKYTVTSRGVVNASFQGTLLVQRGNRVRLDAAGTLDDKPAHPTLISDGKKMEGGSAEKPFGAATPPALGDAMLLGLTRMGLLHNLVVVTNGSPPDGADGSMRTFASVSSVARGANEPVNGVEAERYDFKVVVRGKPMGDATLWINARNGLPLKRHQLVHFPDGELTVDETYEATTGGATEPNTFDPTPTPVEI